MKLLFFCSKQFKGNLFFLLAFFILSLMVNIVEVVVPLFTGNFVDRLSINPQMSVINQYCFALAASTIISILFNTFTNLLYARLQLRSAFSLNKYLLKVIHNKSMLSFIGKDMAALNQQVNTDVNTIIIFFLGFIRDFFSNILISILLIGLCLYFNIKVTICCLLTASLFIILFVVTKPYLYKLNLAMKDSQTIFFGKLFEQIENLSFIKENGISRWFLNRLDGPYKNLQESTMDEQKFLMLLSGIEAFISLLVQLTLLMLGGREILADRFSLGLYVVFSAYLSMLIVRFRYFLNFGKSYQSAMTSYTRLEHILQLPNENCGKQQIDSLSNIKIINLSFSFGPREVFSQLSFLLKRGYIYCLSGDNGSGKTTFLRILDGLYSCSIKRNTIFYNGIDIVDLCMGKFRGTAVVMVSQNPYVFSGTFKDNLLFQEEIDWNFDYLTYLLSGFSLPFKLNDTINIDKLSGGEKQKIAIIRALMRDGSLLLLDEPTSALDKESSDFLLYELGRIKKDKIIVISTHDKQLLENSDYIIPFHA